MENEILVTVDGLTSLIFVMFHTIIKIVNNFRSFHILRIDILYSLLIFFFIFLLLIHEFLKLLIEISIKHF